jgi:protein-S-isoprenylcysteine O-methyltransferase Ste14
MNLEQEQASTASLLLRNLIFTVLQPGLVAGVIPYYIVRGELSLETPWPLHTYFGIGILVVGLIIMLRCILQFALEGKGTLSPVDPTRRLVVRGLYRYSRNPMYVGVMMILIGEAIVAQSGSLWIYLTIIFIGFNLFIMLHEEPRLKKDFGEEYLFYCKSVRRWL